MVNLFANQLTRRIVAGAQKTADSRQATVTPAEAEAEAEPAAAATAAAVAAAAAKETQQQQQQQMVYWSLRPGPLSSMLGVVGSLTWACHGSSRCRKSRKNFPIQSVGAAVCVPNVCVCVWVCVFGNPNCSN